MLQLLSDDDNKRILLCMGASSRLQAENEGNLQLSQMVSQTTNEKFQSWQWTITAVEIVEPVPGWGLLAEHEDSTHRDTFPNAVFA